MDLKVFIFSCLLICSCGPSNPKARIQPQSTPETILNNWHKAAAQGAYQEYFGYFEDSSSVFIGTDATERWTVREFAPWAKPAFEDGIAWDFKAFNRKVNYSEDSSIVWFDEELNTSNLGLLRGSGVLKLIRGEWKIVHYNLSMPIPNDIVFGVVDSIAKYESQKAN